MEAAQKLIDEYANKIEPSQRNERLTLLFAGVWETLNRDRSQTIKGILRFARDQKRRAEKIQAHLDELDKVFGEPDSEINENLREQLSWEQRIFEERERSIQFLCETPVLLEERLGELARAIAAHIDS